jgi:hypothetical protein
MEGIAGLKIASLQLSLLNSDGCFWCVVHMGLRDKAHRAVAERCQLLPDKVASWSFQ